MVESKSSVDSNKSRSKSEEEEVKAFFESKIKAVDYEADLKKALGENQPNSKDEFVTAAEKIKRLESQKAKSPSEYENLLKKIAELKKIEEQEKVIEAQRLEREKLENQKRIREEVSKRDRLVPAVSKQVQKDLKKTVIVKPKDYSFGGIQYEQWEDDGEIVFEQDEQEDQDGLEFASSEFDY